MKRSSFDITIEARVVEFVKVVEKPLSLVRSTHAMVVHLEGSINIGHV